MNGPDPPANRYIVIPTSAQPPANPADLLLSGGPPPPGPAAAGLRSPAAPPGRTVDTSGTDRTDVAGDGQVRQSFAATLDRVAQPGDIARSPDAAGQAPDPGTEFDALGLLTTTMAMPLGASLPTSPLTVVDGVMAGVSEQPAALATPASRQATVTPATTAAAIPPPAMTTPGATLPAPTIMDRVAGSNTGTPIAGDLQQTNDAAATEVIAAVDARLTRTGANEGVRDALRGVTADVSVVRDDASGRPDTGTDTQSGDGRRQMSEGLLQQLAQQQGAGARPANALAQFSLAAGPVAVQPAPTPVTTGGAIGAGTGMNLFYGQQPLSPLGDQGRWSQNLGDRMLMMSDGGVQTARIRLHPEHLGTLEVRIHIEDDTARVFFNATHGQTREALEAALPKLREMFEANGMHLVQADVSADHQQRDTAEDPWMHPLDELTAGPDADLAAELAAAPPPPIVSNRLVDIYA